MQQCTCRADLALRGPRHRPRVTGGRRTRQDRLERRAHTHLDPKANRSTSTPLAARGEGNPPARSPSACTAGSSGLRSPTRTSMAPSGRQLRLWLRDHGRQTGVHPRDARTMPTAPGGTPEGPDRALACQGKADSPKGGGKLESTGGSSDGAPHHRAARRAGVSPARTARNGPRHGHPRGARQARAARTGAARHAERASEQRLIAAAGRRPLRSGSRASAWVPTRGGAPRRACANRAPTAEPPQMVDP